MYTHAAIERNLYNIYYILYIYVHKHFTLLIYGISIEIVIFCNYTHTNLENFYYRSIHIYVIYIMQYKLENTYTSFR